MISWGEGADSAINAVHLLHRVAKPAIEWHFGVADRLHRRSNVPGLQLNDREPCGVTWCQTASA